MFALRKGFAHWFAQHLDCFNTKAAEVSSFFASTKIFGLVLSGQYDTDHLAVVMSQTGGGCRATNYIGF